MTQCPRCSIGDFQAVRRSDGLKHRPTCRQPSFEKLETWFEEGRSKATDGCWVEPDGRCPHGHHSWMIAVGII